MGHFFADIQDFFYSLRGFHELVTKIAEDIDPSLKSVEPYKNFEKSLRYQFKSFNDNHETARKLLIELFTIKQSGKDLPRDQVYNL